MVGGLVMTTEYRHLKRWTLPERYVGASWPEHYVFLGRHRDSDALTRSNFSCGLDRLGGKSETVQVVCESHWAVGWVEWIAIHESDTDALADADEILDELSIYPILDESHYSELEHEENQSVWEIMSLRDRIDALRSCHLSIFAARCQHYLDADDDYGSLYEYLRS